MTELSLPGKLGDPSMELISDPRTDPRIVELIKSQGAFGGDVENIDADSSYDDCVAYTAALEESAAAANPMMAEFIPTFSGVESSAETIKGVDGNDIPLYLHMPKNQPPGPCVVHTHGGGMVMMTAADPSFVIWRQHLANAGIRVVAPEFRNGAGKLGNHPFPAGLNDCASAVQWVHENRDALGVTSIFISGESGGGNLAIATTLKAKQEGWVDQINGVYACCPYIFGRYDNPAPELVSFRENDGYGILTSDMVLMRRVYDPESAHVMNPLAWPYQASLDDLSGLPPHVISVNELDPLRDEGLGFYRKLMAAGVPAMARTVHGTPHAGDLSYFMVAPELFEETLASLRRFVFST